MGALRTRCYHFAGLAPVSGKLQTSAIHRSREHQDGIGMGASHDVTNALPGRQMDALQAQTKTNVAEQMFYIPLHGG